MMCDGDACLATPRMKSRYIVLYSLSGCILCEKACSFLDEANILYDKVVLERDTAHCMTIMYLSKSRSFPQIFINGIYIGGYLELKEMFTFSVNENF